MSAPATSNTPMVSEWLAGIAKAVGFSLDDNKPHEVLAAVADMAEDLGASIRLHDVVAALALVLDCALLEPEDVEALLDAGLGLWTERVP